MPAAIPDRFRLEMRIGRDGDVEEWLATDTQLDRPVLVRSLGPESAPGRRREFVSAVSDAAKVSHPHLCRVFAVAEVEGGAYAVCEWTGGSTTADLVEASHTIELPDFLPNASGLAGGLAALHGQGVAHGDIDLSAISYSVAHPAKLGAFGRVPKTDARGDVRGLTGALESALTGSSPGGPPPSERIDGLPRAIDQILRRGQSGELSAEALEKAFLAAPTPRQPAPEPGASSRKLIVAAIVLVLLAVGLVSLGLVFSEGAGPIVPPPPTIPASSVPGSSTTTTIEKGQVTVAGVTSFDPFGEGGENDDLVPALVDGQLTTAWQTERYQDPLPTLKPGVGIAFAVTGTPVRIELASITEGTAFEIYWSESFSGDLADWARIAGAQAQPGTAVVDVPPRLDGHWLIWLTDLPAGDDGSFYVSIAEVRFVP